MNSQKLRITYVPYHNVGNAYVERMQNVLMQLGTISQFVRPRQLIREIKTGEFRRYDLAIFNWTENEILDARTRKISFFNILKILMKIFFARVVSRRLVFFRHNLYPHSTLPEQEALAKKILGWYEKIFDLTFIHSGAHLGSNRIYCPHPLYKNTLLSQDKSKGDILDDLPNDYFVIFGRIAPYKKILELAKIFPSDKNLLIIGSVSDESYGEEIGKLIRENIIYRPGFLSEEHAQRIILNSSAIVLAHAGDNTVVSGSFFYAVSILVPVLAVETPFLRWIAPHVGEELLVLAPDLEGLAAAAQTFVPRSDLAHLQPQLDRAFGDQAIATALAPALAGL